MSYEPPIEDEIVTKEDNEAYGEQGEEQGGLFNIRALSEHQRGIVLLGLAAVSIFVRNSATVALRDAKNEEVRVLQEERSNNHDIAWFEEGRKSESVQTCREEVFGKCIQAITIPGSCQGMPVTKGHFVNSIKTIQAEVNSVTFNGGEQLQPPCVTQGIALINDCKKEQIKCLERSH